MIDVLTGDIYLTKPLLLFIAPDAVFLCLFTVFSRCRHDWRRKELRVVWMSFFKVLFFLYFQSFTDKPQCLIMFLLLLYTARSLEMSRRPFRLMNPKTLHLVLKCVSLEWNQSEFKMAAWLIWMNVVWKNNKKKFPRPSKSAVKTYLWNFSFQMLFCYVRSFS